VPRTGRSMTAMQSVDRGPKLLPLAGFTIGVTAARRAEELGALLTRRGAEVVHAPAIRIVPLADDAELHAATEQLISDPPDVVVVTTGIGFRGWVEAADGWGLADALVAALRRATLLARGPKARGAIRAAGLTDAWSPASESSAEVLEHLLAGEVGDVEGVRIAVQLHGEPLPDFVDALGCAGAQVVQVPVYRWVPPEDLGPLDRLIANVLDGGVNAVSFTSAPAAASMLSRAGELGVLEPLLGRLRRDVLAACVGPVTAGPLLARDIPTVQPERSRIGALVRTLTEVLPARAPRWPVAGHILELRGQAAVVDGQLCPVPPTPMALLRLLAARPGRVVPRAELLSVMPAAGGDEHAVETAVARLRAALGNPRLVQTVVKRGYRLALEPVSGNECYST
jgi:uroporphyrinogen-III synthase